MTLGTTYPGEPVPYRYITGLNKTAQNEIERNFAHVTNRQVSGNNGPAVFVACVDAQAWELERADYFLSGTSDFAGTDAADIEAIMLAHQGATIIFSTGTIYLERTLVWTYECQLLGSNNEINGWAYTLIRQGSDAADYEAGYFSGSSTNPLRFIIRLDSTKWSSFKQFSVISQLPGADFTTPRACLFSILAIGVNNMDFENIQTQLVSVYFGGSSLRTLTFSVIKHLYKVSGDGVTTHLSSQPAAFGGITDSYMEDVQGITIGGYGAQHTRNWAINCSNAYITYAQGNWIFPGEGIDTKTHNIRGFALPDTGTDPTNGQVPVFASPVWTWAVPPIVGGPLTDGMILVGNASNIAVAVTPTGDVTMTNTGVTTIGALKVTTGKIDALAVTTGKLDDLAVTTGKIAASAVTHAKYQDIADQTFLANNSGGVAAPQAVSVASVKTMLSLGSAAYTSSAAYDVAGAAAAAQAASQPLDSDLTAIAGLTATTDNFIVSVASAWASRTPAQAKTTLALVKGDVGLGSVDNTADTAKPVSTAQQTALDLKANLASPALTGNPTAPTPTGGDNDTSIATTAFVQGELGAIAGAPAGAILMYGGAAAPTGYLLCDGTAVSRTTYAALYAITGDAFGAGNGTTTFNVPDMRDRLPMGVSGTKVLGTTLAAATHTHGVGSMAFPNHSHSGTGLLIPTHSHGAGTLIIPTHSHTMSSHTHGHGSLDHVHSGNTLHMLHTHDLGDAGWAKIAMGTGVYMRRITVTAYTDTHLSGAVAAGASSVSRTLGAGLGGTTNSSNAPTSWTGNTSGVASTSGVTGTNNDATSTAISANGVTGDTTTAISANAITGSTASDAGAAITGTSAATQAPLPPYTALNFIIKT